LKISPCAAKSDLEEFDKTMAGDEQLVFIGMSIVLVFVALILGK
jgi:hypothetical protein